MKSFLVSDAVVNYNSSSYGGVLFRSPNSPPPSPSPSSDSLSQLFLGARSGFHGYYESTPSGCFQLRQQPPLLPFPRSATLPSQGKWTPEGKSRRKNSKRKGKMFIGRAINGKEDLKDKRNEKEERRLLEEKVIESPPPSSLPFPKFSMRPKANVESPETYSRNPRLIPHFGER